jgi:hypothetical protein
MLGARKERRPERLVPISLEAAVPADHFYRYLDSELGLITPASLWRWFAMNGSRPSTAYSPAWGQRETTSSTEGMPSASRIRPATR